MNYNKVIILSGYDYSESFKYLSGFEYSVIIPKNEPLLDEGARERLSSVLGGKLSELNYQDVEQHILAEKPDILITFGWRRIVSSNIINSAKYAINVHPAILPEYKGYHPVPHVLINNESHHGVTAHIITDALDAGDIIHIEKFEISKFSTLNEIQTQVNDIMPQFLVKLFDKIFKGDFTLLPNDNSKTKVIAGKRTPEDSEISLDMPIGQAYDYIRACDEVRFPAFIMIDGKKVILKIDPTSDN
ncbi:formyltransferase family protein [Vibrio mimicus]|uniref:formyltransferase family protein n=1 Tax=Vibrio mimicus TaxID=674 RepID=UPI002FF2DDE7